MKMPELLDVRQTTLVFRIHRRSIGSLAVFPREMTFDNAQRKRESFSLLFCYALSSRVSSENVNSRLDCWKKLYSNLAINLFVMK